MTEQAILKQTGDDRLPGDLDREDLIARIIRVDQAGEYGAKRIYAGQLAVLANSPSAPTIRHMAEQEQHHLDAFDRMMAERHVRPSILGPVWHAAGFALGAATALMGERAAMACTEAVEEVIDEHYGQQLEKLGADEPELREAIIQFRAEEVEHRDTARAEGAAQAPGYEVLRSTIKAGSRLAIWLAERF